LRPGYVALLRSVDRRARSRAARIQLLRVRATENCLGQTRIAPCCDPVVRRRSGWPAKLPRHFPGTGRRHISFATTIEPSAAYSHAASRRWAFGIGPHHSARPGKIGHIERLIGSIRRECTDHLIVFNEEHLRRILAKFSTYYNGWRPYFAWEGCTKICIKWTTLESVLCQ
jgi:hypothetical protein